MTREPNLCERLTHTWDILWPGLLVAGVFFLGFWLGVTAHG